MQTLIFLIVGILFDATIYMQNNDMFVKKKFQQHYTYSLYYKQSGSAVLRGRLGR